MSLINLQEIDKMYIVKVTNGCFIRSGSFKAYDINENEYFAHSSVVEKNKDKFDALNTQQNSFWVLVEKQNWGVKWDNREVSGIITISELIEDCKLWKENLFYKKIIKYNLHLMEQSRLDAINIHNFNNESPYSNDIEILRKLLIDLNTKIDIY
jgi:hypothetical protein